MRNDKMCLNKKAYASKTEAEQAIQRILQKRKVGLRSYLCPNCKWYHMTKQIVNKLS